MIRIAFPMKAEANFCIAEQKQIHVKQLNKTDYRDVKKDLYMPLVRHADPASSVGHMSEE